MKSKLNEVIHGEIGRIVNYRSIVSTSLDQRYGLVAKKQGILFPHSIVQPFQHLDPDGFSGKNSKPPPPKVVALRKTTL